MCHCQISLSDLISFRETPNFAHRLREHETEKWSFCMTPECPCKAIHGTAQLKWNTPPLAKFSPPAAGSAAPPPVSRQLCWLGGARQAGVRHRKRRQQVYCYHLHGKGNEATPQSAGNEAPQLSHIVYSTALNNILIIYMGLHMIKRLIVTSNSLTQSVC